jgi:hypothetical protein
LRFAYIDLRENFNLEYNQKVQNASCCGFEGGGEVLAEDYTKILVLGHGCLLDRAGEPGRKQWFLKALR